MSGHNYPDNLYADSLKPTGAYNSAKIRESDPLGDAIASLGVIAAQVETLRREFEALRNRGFGAAQKSALHEIRKTLPKWSPDWATHWVNPNPAVLCSAHPMSAEALRAQDEKPGDRL